MHIPPIEHSVFINASPGEVYETLTTANGWNAWFTTGSTIDARVGGILHLKWVNWGPTRTTCEDICAITEMVPNEKFSFDWEPGESKTHVSFTLTPQGSGTVLQVIEYGYSSLAAFPDCATGWGEAATLLKFYLEHGITYGDVPTE